jgi:uncharacterized protein with HEPN domain
MLAWSLPRQQVFAPCPYTRYWRRRENLLARQCATLPWAIIPQQYEKCGLDQTQFDASKLHQAAVARCIGIVGEVATKVSREFRDAHPDIPWHEIIGMRHRLIHDYADLRLDKVWSVLQDELPGLIAGLQPLIPPPDAEP